MRKNIKGIAAGGLGLLALQLPGMTVFAQAAETDMKARLGNALMNTVLGMGTVFVMLIAIALIIYCFRIIPVIQSKFAKKEEAVAEAPKAAPAPAAKPAAAPSAAGSISITAGAAGKVVDVVASPGAAVKKGDPVVVLEIMKMETPVVAPEDGTVASVEVAKGETVESGAVLATMNA